LPAQSSTQLELKRAFYSNPVVTANHLYEVYKGGNGVAVGQAGEILWYDPYEDAWTVHADSGLVVTSLMSLCVSALGEVAIVGVGGTIIRGTLGAVYAGVGQYVFAADPQSGVITANILMGVTWPYVFGVGADRIIAVGQSGTILRYDDSAWGAVTWDVVHTPITEDLYSVDWAWSVARTLMVAVGGNGGVYKSDNDGLTWSVLAAAGDVTSELIEKVKIVSPDDPVNIWMVGQSGLLLQYYDGEWYQHESPTTANLHDVHFFNEDDGYAVGDSGMILYWDGVSWRKLKSPTAQSLQSIFGVHVDEMAVVGVNGTTLNYLGDVLPIANIERTGTMAPLPLSEMPYEAQVFTDLEIRDGLAHDSDIADMHRYKYVTIFVLNTHDEDVTIQVRANMDRGTTNAQDVGGSFVVAALTGVEARTMVPEACGWLPYLYLEATPAAVPTLGDLNAYMIGRN
jgi:hypothetical protein